MTDVHRLLAKARLEPTAPYTSADLDAAEERLAARLAYRQCPPERRTSGTPLPRPQGRQRRNAHDFAADLRALCEIVITRPDAMNELHDFLEQSFPQPRAAAVLGSILYLAGAADSAQFWWQYAAGAGDPRAAYCLYLHHQALGEEGQAHWWYTQADLTVAPMRQVLTEVERTVALRALRTLKEHQGLPEPLAAVLAYVPAAVGYLDNDVDLPLPDPDFVDRIETLLGLAPTPAGPPQPCSPSASPRP
ncbi:hypothetical protein [Streptomyces barkulensis]|uniref:hypothetical protein n=1 Tax=Streptomyces barkulensis TaxID=1257026 RepID=UPI000C6E8A08|nr:hypothetical protein [Streptomyces barkulensis]